MSVALSLLLCAQLNSFEFSDISSPQYAGDSFPVTIVARDRAGAIYPFNGDAVLSTTADDYWTFIAPRYVRFSNGVWQGGVVITLADTLRIRCLEPQSLVTATSALIEVVSGPPQRFVVILPGEELGPGSEVGRVPNKLPYSQTAGDTFSVDVYLTDAWHNPVLARDDSVFFVSTDSFALLPAGEALANGQGRFPVAMRAAGEQRLSVRGGPGSSMSPDTSTPFTVTAGAFDRLLVLLPGETHLPGDNATAPWQSPGKAGSPTRQYVQADFPVTVYACDRCWNRVPGNGDTVFLASDFQFEPTPDREALADSAVFLVRFMRADPNQNIWAYQPSTGLASYRTEVDILGRGRFLAISAPDTVRAGETTYIRVTVTDPNQEPVVAVPCYFTVDAGHGVMIDPALLTDTVGVVRARFVCEAQFGAEHDSIRISCGVDTTIEIYVDRYDTLPISIFPNPFGFPEETCVIEYYLQRSGTTTVTIYDLFGNEVIRWRFAAGQSGALSGVNRVHWDGRNSRGRRVASGIYVVHILGQLHTTTTFRNDARIGVAW